MQRVFNPLHQIYKKRGENKMDKSSIVIREFENLKIVFSDDKFYGCAVFADTLVPLTTGYTSILPLFKEIEFTTDALIALEIISTPITNNKN